MRLVLALLILLAPPAMAQTALGQSGLSLSGSTTIMSDYLFRGISQTRSRPALQGVAELSHADSGLYIAAFVSNAKFLGYDATAEVDLYGGWRVSAAGFDVDVSAIWYHYPGFTRRGGQPRLDYAEGVVRVTRAIGPVTVSTVLAGSPNFFSTSGTGIYLEGGVDWRTGVAGVTLGARYGRQWIQRNANFGAPDYGWWSLTVGREFELPRLGTIAASIGYYQTSVARADCVPVGGPRGNMGQDICGARALASLAFRF